MKKHLILLISAIFLLASCSSDDEPVNDAVNEQINSIASVLNGTFIASEYSSVTNTTEVTEITFNPYSTPKKEEWIDNSISKEILMYGECTIVHYFNDHLLETTNEWKYNIEIAYEGAQPKLNYYPDVYGRTESHSITIDSSSSFTLDGVIYNKQ